MLSTNIRSHTEFLFFIFKSLRIITCLVESVSFIRHGWRKRAESCHKIMFQSRSICDRNTSIVQKAYGNETLNRSNVCRLYSQFRDRRDLIEDKERGSHPKSTQSEVNFIAVADLVKNDHRILARKLAKSLNISKTVVLRILKKDLRK
jgi:hypothetical protein